MKRIIFCYFFVFLFGGFLSYVLFHPKSSNESYVKFPSVSEERENSGKFTNPLLDCVQNKDEGMETLSVSQTKLKNEVQQIVSNNKASKVSVYFRDLKNGPWIGVNEEEKFIGGSLLKLPILITYMKLAESDNKILDESLDFKQENVSNRQYFTSSKQLEIGKSYKIKDLLDYMITYSDNNAAYLLMSHISKDDINKTFASLGFGEPQQDQPFPVDTKTYAGFFRVLYNTSYLNQDYSEKALQMLANSEFNKGIQAGLPKDITVSHKFGERSEGDTNQLHDCGIVYYPGHPYLLCVMTQGDNFDNLASVIAQISNLVYQEITLNIKNK